MQRSVFERPLAWRHWIAHPDKAQVLRAKMHPTIWHWIVTLSAVQKGSCSQILTLRVSQGGRDGYSQQGCPVSLHKQSLIGQL